jgi:hypothetical protein
MFISFHNSEDIHDTNWEFMISSNSVVNLESGLFIHYGKSNFTSSEGEI